VNIRCAYSPSVPLASSSSARRSTEFGSSLAARTPACLFDEMPRRNEVSRSKRLAASGGAHLSKVVTDRIMSFLPSGDVSSENCSKNIRCLDFSSCLILEDIMLINCQFKSRLIVSPSLKRLTLKCCSFGWDTRARISVPKLVFLMLASCNGRTPILDKMPCPVSAFVRLQADIYLCDNYYETGCCNSCTGCRRRCVSGRNTSVLLEAISGATHLELGLLLDCFTL
jgi:hypothetical protein